MAAILKIYFEILFQNQKAIWLKTWEEESGHSYLKLQGPQIFSLRYQ